MFNPDLLTDEEWNLITRELVLASQDEEWKTILDLCESINKQCEELRKTLDIHKSEQWLEDINKRCEELRKTLDTYEKEANSGSQN